MADRARVLGIAEPRRRAMRSELRSRRFQLEQRLFKTGLDITSAA